MALMDVHGAVARQLIAAGYSDKDARHIAAMASAVQSCISRSDLACFEDSHLVPGIAALLGAMLRASSENVIKSADFDMKSRYEGDDQMLRIINITNAPDPSPMRLRTIEDVLRERLAREDEEDIDTLPTDGRRH